jgi:MerR family transcriptional regulator, mercuric resistance operon regulatory protein
MRNPITIGRLSAETGVNIETIRYYERIGLMNTPARSPGGRRLYVAQDVSRLRFIRRGRGLGFSLETIRSLMRIEREDKPCTRVKALTEAHLAEVREKINDLQRLESTLARLAQACDDASSRSCPVIEALAQR